MANRYLSPFVGVKDGTKVPADRADGRMVGAKKSVICGRKNAGEAWNDGDKIYVGTLRAGEMLLDVKVTTATSFGSATVSLGTLGSAAKYVSAKTHTATNVPTSLGPLPAALVAGPLADDEDLWITVATANIADTTVAFVELEIASVK